MKFLLRFLPHQVDVEEAQAMKREAVSEHTAALESLEAAREQSAVLRKINARNHFSESLTRTFQGRGAV
ncbi:DUF7620 family protein [Paeniglutamicibacter gangotriensis]|uniref:Uncharacterized protein n=1 Tax=Paeniglutamicibacter gangotriensis Lz1y TaxID=1276920 RepID=M7MPQ1_9MICC|nr:hypothetical protein ADIAG_02350 [Paeniglutamicibacter gangotriensis Lz1y]